ncbi:MAG: hypothetical protein UT30_C0011G0043 [Candidatus Uhrbacteria bacterium GW2011_GWF2_39_13]|uniref:Uncharacterized protein n=1 Tax=Candidatus Uhrbacteria bacterium GW2011_GWF2_39_13 TaxID=1618995 RepID=A0A0G0QRG1_9BACT|nr:MAG: hypothetical protein UT30_C0011G0043 [Candidatus Uhrbacteria bacterium GW2011_GWF2_39_13]HAU66630.1 hypothetical protein [Candidatus Uhrbacteria bacterium]
MDATERIVIKIAKVIGWMILIVLGAEIICFALSLPVWLTIKAEQRYEVYPLISKETISLKEEMWENYQQFHVACREHGDLYGPVERRKELAQEAGFRIFISLLFGTSYATHSKWICGANGTVNIRTDLNPLK